MNKPQKQRGGEPIHHASFKIAVAREYLTTSLGYIKLAKKYSLSPATVQYFVKWYRHKYPDGMIAGYGDGNLQQDVDSELKEARLKVTALEMLIENAGKELGVDLVKKFGTKQPGK